MNNELNNKILIVDDDIGILQGFRRALRGSFQIEIASSAYAALEEIKRNGPYAVIITDMMMPGLNGIDLLKKLEIIEPNAVKIMLSGNNSQKTAIDAINIGKVYKFLSKPINSTYLKEVISAALDQFNQELLRQEDIDLQNTEVNKLTSELNYHYHRDPLTGLLNRSTFITELSEFFKQKEKEILTLCYLDIDFFHLINESVGNSGGDELLKQISYILTESTPTGSLLARLNGDAFCLLIKKSLQNVAPNIDKIQQRINAHVLNWNGKSTNVTVSLGVIPIEDCYANANVFLNCAENACFLAKEEGRNRAHWGDSNDTTLTTRLDEINWVNKLEDIIDKKQFILYYQDIYPIINGNSKLHYEILLRYEPNKDKVLLPADILSAAEHYQLSPKIDRWVIATYAQWLAKNPCHLEQLELCSINLSGCSLNEGGMAKYILDTFAKYNIPKEKICFEITETAAVGYFANAINFINTLRNQGIKFALDDFGTGLSSYSYLKNLPIDILKIDGAFVKNIYKDKIDLAFVQSICDIGHTMGLKIVAEYVESKAIYDVLEKMNVDYGQGFYLAKPKRL
jgi:diguanylate cyclase (GGDEF)-like protein